MHAVAEPLQSARLALAKLRRDIGTEGATAVMDVYLEVTPPNIAGIAEGITQRDALKLTYEAHKLKGASGTLGLDRIRELATKLEHLGKNNSFDCAAEYCQGIRTEYEAFITAYTSGTLTMTTAAT